jgi:predicted Fe-Mo cluster-binding NifX family protein
MKIVATSTGRDLDSALDPRFGRCAYFAVLDSESGALEAIPNPFLDAAGGAGTQAAQWVLDQGAEILLTGQCGPKAAAVLRDAGIRVVEGASGSLREAAAPFRTTPPHEPAREPARPDARESATVGTGVDAGFGAGLGAGNGAGACRRVRGGRGPGGGSGAGRGRGRNTGAGWGPGRRGRS